MMNTIITILILKNRPCQHQEKESKTALKVSSIRIFQDIVLYPMSLHAERLHWNQNLAHARYVSPQEES